MNSTFSVTFEKNTRSGRKIFEVTGQAARVLVLLVNCGRDGVSTSDVSAWCHRISQYILVLRSRYFLEISLHREPAANAFGDYTWQGRYVLETDVRILSIVTPIAA